jgi:hypothetical protein
VLAHQLPPATYTSTNPIIGNVVDRSISIGTGWDGVYVTDGDWIYPVNGNPKFPVQDPDPNVGPGIAPAYGAAFFASGLRIPGSGFTNVPLILEVTENWSLVPNIAAPTGIPFTPGIAPFLPTGNICPCDTLLIGVDTTCTFGTALPNPDPPNMLAPTYWLTSAVTTYNPVYTACPGTIAVAGPYMPANITAALIGLTFYVQIAYIPVCLTSCVTAGPPSVPVVPWPGWLNCTANAIYLTDLYIGRVSDY